MALSKYTILVADYTPTDMMLLKILLKQTHCRLLTATDGINALKQAREEHPDLLLLNTHLPGMSGFEIAAALQQDTTTCNIPILYMAEMSDYPIFTPEHRWLREEEYIGKPFDMERLVTRIVQQLKKNKK